MPSQARTNHTVTSQRAKGLEKETMTLRKAILVALFPLFVLTAGFPAAAEAGGCPGPHGWTGAQNMRAAFDWGNALVRNENGVGVQPGGGMFNAMFGNGTGNGNLGMAGAIANSTEHCD
jgi:hypothetical protein